MSLIYIDGFEWAVHQVVGFGGAGRWSGTGSVGNFNRITDTASGFGAAIRMRSTSAELQHVFSPALSTLVLGFRYRTEILPNSQIVVLEIANGGLRQVELRMNPDGTFEAYAGGSSLGTKGTFSIPGLTWTYIEIKVFIHASAGTYELRINGNPTPDIDLTGLDTHTTGSAEVNGIILFGQSASDLDYDDLYIDDSTFHGDVFVHTIVADGAGADADFTPSAGSNFENIEELPSDEDTTYNESEVVDDRDRFTHGDLPADTDVVLGVQVGMFCKKATSGDRELRTLAYDGVTEGEGAAQTLSTDWLWLYDMFEDHPTGAAPWTESEVNSGEFGYTVES